MRTTKILLSSCAAALAAFATLPAAADWRPDAVAVQGGVGEDVDQAAVGVVWDWDWQLKRRGLFTAHTELLVSRWRTHQVGGGRYHLHQVALVPMLRIRPDAGAAAWFLEFGIGASYLTRDYVTPERTFSTRWNFYDVIGAGFSFGERRRHELGLRYVHVSNGGVRQPNPGEDFLLLRYTARF